MFRFFESLSLTTIDTMLFEELPELEVAVCVGRGGWLLNAAPGPPSCRFVGS